MLTVICIVTQKSVVIFFFFFLRTEEISVIHVTLLEVSV